MIVVMVLDLAKEHGFLEEPIHGLLSIFQIQHNLTEVGDKRRKSSTGIPCKLEACHTVKSNDNHKFQVISTLVKGQKGLINSSSILGLFKLTKLSQGDTTQRHMMPKCYKQTGFWL